MSFTSLHFYVFLITLLVVLRFLKYNSTKKAMLLVVIVLVIGGLVFRSIKMALLFAALHLRLFVLEVLKCWLLETN